MMHRKEEVPLRVGVLEGAVWIRFVGSCGGVFWVRVGIGWSNSLGFRVDPAVGLGVRIFGCVVGLWQIRRCHGIRQSFQGRVESRVPWC